MLTKLLKIARQAGDAIMEVYNDPNFEASIEQKGDDSPLTLADKKAHLVIDAALRAWTPDIPILSEEGKSISYAERKKWNRFWCVDPLDGTKEFIKRNGEFVVHIALIVDNEALVGVVHAPVKGITYLAQRGEGAFRIANGLVEKIEAARYKPSDEGLTLVASRSHLSPETSDYIAKFKSPNMISMGSSLKFMAVAEGTAHEYPRLGPTMEWDSAAPQVIVEEAGGSVLRHDDGKPLRYNKENLLNPWFLVKGRS